MSMGRFEEILWKLLKWVLEHPSLLLQAVNSQLAAARGQMHIPAAVLEGALAVRNARDFVSERMKLVLEAEIARYDLETDRIRYFMEDAYWQTPPMLLLFMMVWLVVEGLERRVSLGRVLEAAVSGIIGYRILDLHFDGGLATQAEVMMGMGLIAKEEHLLLEQYGYSSENANIVLEFKTEALIAEAREKHLRWSECSVSADAPHELGRKGAMIVPLFALPLQLLGRGSDIHKYHELVLRMSAGVQVLDDTHDVAEDLTNGYYSLISRGFQDVVQREGPEKAATMITNNSERMREAYTLAVTLLREASQEARGLDDAVLGLACQYFLHRVHMAFGGQGGVHA